MTVGGASGSPAVFQGEAADRGRGWGIDPFSDASRRHTAPRRGNGRERYLQNPWRGVIPVAGRMHLGVTHGGRQGRGRGIDPFPDVSRCRHTAPRRGNRQGKVFAKSMERRDPSGLANASWGHTRGPPGAGTGYWPLNLGFPPPPYRPASGERQGKVFAKSMERRDPSGLANASWGHTRGSQGAGWGLGPLTWASRHRRGGLPIRSSEGDRPHMGQGGI